MVLALHVAGARYGIHWALVLLLLLAAVTGHPVEALLLILSLAAHELAHLVAAGLAGVAVEELTLTPCGGMLRLEGALEGDPGAEVAVALAGPFQSALLATLVHFIAPLGLWDPHLLGFFRDANGALAFVNLLPALPLDGGRALRGLLARRWGYGTVTRWMSYCGRACGLVLTVAGALALLTGTLWWAALASGPFLYWAARREEDAMPYRSMGQLLRKRAEVRRRGIMVTSTLVARADLRLADVMPYLGARRYHLVLVVDDNLRPLATLSEGQLVQALATWGPQRRLQEIL